MEELSIAWCLVGVNSTHKVQSKWNFAFQWNPTQPGNCNRAICVHISDIVVSVGLFLLLLFVCFHQALDLCVSLACWLLLTMYFQVFWRWQECHTEELKSFWVPFPFPALLTTWKKTPFLTYHRLSQPRLLLFVSFASSWMQMKIVGTFLHHLNGNMLWPAPLSIWSVLR